jgi:preprotein translocase subunit SecB
MKPSPLALENYFVTELIFSANKDFDPKQPGDMGFDDLIVEHTCLPGEPDSHGWQVSLRLRFQPKAETNYPYTFVLELVGLFRVLGDPPAALEEPLVNTNAPSMLFGAAREIVRAATSRGPFVPVLLPSVSFHPSKSPGNIDAAQQTNQLSAAR